VSTAAGLLLLDPPSTVTSRTRGSAGVGPPTTNPVLQIDLSRLYSGESSSDDTSSSLATTYTAFPWPMLGAVVVVPLPWPPTVSVPGICTPQDSSPFSYTTTPMSSNVGSSHNSHVHIGWSEHIGAQHSRGGGGMTSVEDGLGVNFPNKVDNMTRLKPEPRPLSSRLVSPSPVYYHARRMHI
jgi:hypothetical protein